MVTNQEMLDEVQKAIKAVLVGGQEYTSFGVGVKRPSLAELREQETYYKRQVARENSGGIDSKRAVPYP